MKRLVVCCDGTWNSDDAKNPTNVVKLYRAIVLQDGNVPQIPWYDPGVGTENRLSRAIGGVTGLGLTQNVEDAYRFLIRNYEPGDEVYLFGFSRGAYTARSLGGLIRNSGILRRDYEARVSQAIKLYRDRKRDPYHPAVVRFRGDFSHPDFRLKLIGVWDTVGALGIPGNVFTKLNQHLNSFHDVKLSRSVEFGYQALAVDEHRRAFSAALWEVQDDPTATAGNIGSLGGSQVVEQVWFAGAHSDVGGGYSDHRLSDAALTWMLERVAAAGLALKSDAIPGDVGAHDARIHNSRSGIFQYLPGIDREVGKQAVEDVHETVQERVRSSDYAPKGLRESRFWAALRGGSDGTH
ncbi:MAG: DUF2235 domain-containing protein [Chloroflexi bacterium]|nr:DUF2235 domain-containing protein [Chloroflexota bacterium]MDA1146851.1 DUF2235 domain-containing protein [Chloroflexota bacterium]